ncbi:unnamed protein product [Mytilus coruscus]|uniref:B box-type domain-containing protein n=1 Tax=Mytilus coruscus TaxID=42192 RepID=A0A6J8AMJ0_MYTCO|nr:unnamed protein product [Mytilus coruscus]
MASSSWTSLCTLCQEDDVSSQAVTWCTECEVMLCIDCDKHHNKSRSSQHHNTMSTEDYHELPVFIQGVSSRCKDHNKKFELYCSFHACPCCVQCVSNHQKCQDMKPLDDILTHVKSSASVQLLENDLKDLEENFHEVLNYLKSRLDKSNIKKTEAIEEIRIMRESIDDYINRLEQQILDELESKHSKMNSIINTLVNQIEHRSAEVHKLQVDFSKMTHFATELQMYVGLREIEKTTSEAAKYISDLEVGGHLNEKKIEIKISPSLQSIIEEVKSFGDIYITTNNNSSFSVHVNTERRDQAQFLVNTDPGMDQIEPSLLTKWRIPKKMKPCYVIACRILPDGKILILDNRQRRLLLFSKSGFFIRIVVTFKVKPYDLCFVRNNTVAISFRMTNLIELVDIAKNETTKRLILSHACHGVTSDGQILVISSVNEKKCSLVNLQDMSPTVLLGVWGTCIALFNEKIYCADSNENKVSCYRRSGEPLWTFMHTDIRNIYGLALDINGYVYIASHRNDVIVVVSPDGKTSKIIQSNADGIINPTGTDINTDKGMMIVSCQISNDDAYILVFKT